MIVSLSGDGYKSISDQADGTDRESSQFIHPAEGSLHPPIS